MRGFNDVIEYAILILLAVFAILTVINAIYAVIIVRPFIGSLSFNNIVVSHGETYAFLTAFSAMTHSGKDILVQIVMVRLFSMLVMEIALLSVVAGLFVIRKVLNLSVADRAKLLAETERAGAPEIDNGIVTGQLSSGRAVIHN